MYVGNTDKTKVKEDIMTGGYDNKNSNNYDQISEQLYNYYDLENTYKACKNYHLNRKVRGIAEALYNGLQDFHAFQRRVEEDL